MSARGFDDNPVGTAVARKVEANLIPQGATTGSKAKVATPTGVVLGEVWAERSQPGHPGGVHTHWRSRDRGTWEDRAECYRTRDDAVAAMYDRQGVPIPTEMP